MGAVDAEWQARVAALQGHYDLQEPLLAAHVALLRVLDCTARLPPCLIQAAATARKEKRLLHAATAVHDLKRVCRQLELQGPAPLLTARVQPPSPPPILPAPLI